jgi:hypothetical protein
MWHSRQRLIPQLWHSTMLLRVLLLVLFFVFFFFSQGLTLGWFEPEV